MREREREREHELGVGGLLSSVERYSCKYLRSPHSFFAVNLFLVS